MLRRLFPARALPCLLRNFRSGRVLMRGAIYLFAMMALGVQAFIPRPCLLTSLRMTSRIRLCSRSMPMPSMSLLGRRSMSLLSTTEGKRAARQRTKDEVRRRNERYRQQSSLADPGSLYAVRVSVCPILRDELQLNGREKRGRLFVESGSVASR